MRLVWAVAAASVGVREMQVSGAIGPSTMRSDLADADRLRVGDEVVTAGTAAAAVDQTIRLQLQEDLLEEFPRYRRLHGDLVGLQRPFAPAARASTSALNAYFAFWEITSGELSTCLPLRKPIAAENPVAGRPAAARPQSAINSEDERRPDPAERRSAAHGCHSVCAMLSGKPPRQVRTRSLQCSSCKQRKAPSTAAG